MCAGSASSPCQLALPTSLCVVTADETGYSEPEGDMAAFLLSGGMHGNNPEAPGHRDIIGPTAPRGKTNGMIIRGGRIVAEWGPTDRVDMTFSATKSYLSTMVGLAWGEGLLDLDELVFLGTFL